MRVLFDISVLGFGHLDPRDRTGLFRVVENLVFGLHASPECDLRLTATQNARAATVYLASRPGLAGVPFSGSRIGLGRALDDRQLGLNTRIFDSAGYRRAMLRVQRKLLFATARLMEPISPPIDPTFLADAQIYHSPGSILPRQAKHAHHIQRFLTVYDLTPILMPQFFESVRKEFFADLIRSLAPSDWALCISQSAKSDLCDYLGISPDHVFVTCPAADPEIFRPCDDPVRLAVVRAKYGIPEAPYLLSLSALEPRKNLDRVVQAFARLVQEEHLPDLRLVLAGPKVRLYDRILAAVAKWPQVRDRIVLTGYVADEDLAALYSGAMAFVFMSLYEGFGLPPLEAMQCGIPVITSNTSSLPEVVGDAGLMLDPTDLDGLAEALLRVCQDPSLRANMKAKSLERAKRFSWPEFVRQTISGYRTALSAS